MAYDRESGESGRRFGQHPPFHPDHPFLPKPREHTVETKRVDVLLDDGVKDVMKVGEMSDRVIFTLTLADGTTKRIGVFKPQPKNEWGYFTHEVGKDPFGRGLSLNVAFWRPVNEQGLPSLEEDPPRLPYKPEREINTKDQDGPIINTKNQDGPIWS